MKPKFPHAVKSKRQDIETTIRALKYIADSPDKKYGGFDAQTKITAASALREIRRLRMAVNRLTKRNAGRLNK